MIKLRIHVTSLSRTAGELPAVEHRHAAAHAVRAARQRARERAPIGARAGLDGENGVPHWSCQAAAASFEELVAPGVALDWFVVCDAYRLESKRSDCCGSVLAKHAGGRAARNTAKAAAARSPK